MNKSSGLIIKMLTTAVIVIILSAACTVASSLSIPTQTLFPTQTSRPTETPTQILPTLTLTPTPIPQPYDYLLTVDELPLHLYKSFTLNYVWKENDLIYQITFFDASVGHIKNSIIVASKPYTKLPIDNYLTPIHDTSIAQNARAYSSNSVITYDFYKGNSLVEIEGDITLADAISMGKKIEDRLPDQIAVSPITFPSQIDIVTFGKYIESLTLGKLVSGSNDPVPADTFNKSDEFCLTLKPVDSADSGDSDNSTVHYSFAVYDTEQNKFVFKFIPEFSIYCYPFLGVSHSGKYEIWFAVNDTLVSKLPFEVK